MLISPRATRATKNHSLSLSFTHAEQFWMKWIQCAWMRYVALRSPSQCPSQRAPVDFASRIIPLANTHNWRNGPMGRSHTTQRAFPNENPQREVQRTTFEVGELSCLCNLEQGVNERTLYGRLTVTQSGYNWTWHRRFAVAAAIRDAHRISWWCAKARIFVVVGWNVCIAYVCCAVLACMICMDMKETQNVCGCRCSMMIIL